MRGEGEREGEEGCFVIVSGEGMVEWCCRGVVVAFLLIPYPYTHALAQTVFMKSQLKDATWYLKKGTKGRGKGVWR